MSENLPEHIGPYQILREAGRGGISTVYEAVDTRIGRVVGVKVLSGLPHVSDAERQRQTARLVQEGRAVAGLSHPNIVTVFDVGEIPTTDNHGSPPLPYLVMEFLRGETLRERLNRVGRLSPPDATLILDQAAQGLHAAHKAGIVHRDIKPENIMLMPDGGVKIMDFGVAQRQESVPKYDIGLPPDALPTGNSVVGSSAYLSPEQARGEAAEVTAASDIWSLGVVLYEMLSGENPFASDSGRDDAEATRSRILTMRPAPPPGAGPRVQRVLERALDPEAGNRFPTAPALADAFRMAWVTDNAPALPADAESNTDEAAMVAAPAAAALSIPAASPPEEPTPVFPEPASQPPAPPPLPVAEPYLPAGQHHPARRRASWLVPALLALAVFGLAVSLPLLLERQKRGGTGRAPEPAVAVATGPPPASDAAADNRPPPDAGPVRASSRSSVEKSQPQQKPDSSGRPAGAAPRSATGESRQPPPPGPVVVTEKPQPTPAKPAAESGRERQVPVQSLPPPPGPRGARAPAAVAGPAAKPEPKDIRKPEAAERTTSPVPVEAEGESDETLTFLGEWRGRHTGREATLFIDREEPVGAFQGTMTVQTASGPVVLDVAGKLDDEKGEPRVILRERRILEEPVRRSWDLGVNTGRLTEGGGMSGTGRDSRGRTYQWQFRR